MPVTVSVHGANADLALRELKKNLQRENVFKTLKAKRHYESPSTLRAREEKEIRRKKSRRHHNNNNY